MRRAMLLLVNPLGLPGGASGQQPLPWEFWGMHPMWDLWGSR
jgi:hypothetical protein